MNKIIFILALCALQGACAHHDHGGRAPLLSYQELGAEISVARVELEGTREAAAELEDVVAATR